MFSAETLRCPLLGGGVLLLDGGGGRAGDLLDPVNPRDDVGDGVPDPRRHLLEGGDAPRDVPGLLGGLVGQAPCAPNALAISSLMPIPPPTNPNGLTLKEYSTYSIAAISLSQNPPEG